jgi:hypothetical protein
MPDLVNDDDLSALAAEYVLGTLEPDERTRANVLLDVDHGFRGLVRVWERRLGELHLMVEPVEPDPRIWEGIKGKLGTSVAVAAPIPESPPPPIVETPAEPQPAASRSGSTEQKLAELALEVEKFKEAVHPSEPTASPPPVIPPAPTPEISGAAAPEPAAAEPVVTPPVAPVPAETAVVETAKFEERVPERVGREPPRVIPADRIDTDERRKRPARVAGWRTFSLLMTLVAFGLGGLIAAWRYIPEQLPLQLRPGNFLKLQDTPTPPPPIKKPPAPPSFDE